MSNELEESIDTRLPDDLSNVFPDVFIDNSVLTGEVEFEDVLYTVN